MIRTLRDAWIRNAEHRPNQEAVVFGEVRLTYAMLVDRAHRIGAYLHTLGLGPGDRVAILAMNRAEWFEIYAACEMAGFIAAPVNARLASAEIGMVLENSGAKAVLFEAEFAETIATLRDSLQNTLHFFVFGENVPAWAETYAALLSGNPAGAPTRPQPDDIVHLMYTGGSTGRPKGVARSHAAAIATSTSNCLIAGLNSGSTQLVVMPMFHIGGQAMAMAQHWIGGKVVLLPRFDAHEVVAAIAREKVTMLNLAPTLIRQMLDAAEEMTCNLSTLETLSYAAAPMPVTLLRRCIEKMGLIFVNNYGSTEAGPAIFLPKQAHKIDAEKADGARLLGSIGQPSPLVSARIVDAEGAECAPGITGELMLASPQLLTEYWNDPAATREAFDGEWFATGDMAYFDDEKHVFLVDRKKNMIISGGENVYPAEVEEALRLHPAVVDAVVVGVPDDRWGEMIAAAIELRSGLTVTEEEIIHFCSRHIAGYKKPRRIRFVTTLPRLASGKEDRLTVRTLMA